MKKKTIGAILLTSFLSITTLGLATYSIYDFNTNGKGSIDTNNLSVTAKIEKANIYHNGKLINGNKFNNGGNFEMLPDGKISINNMSKNDSLRFNLNVKNANNYGVLVKIKDQCLKGLDFYKNLEINVLDNWVYLAKDSTIDLPVEIKCKETVKDESSKVSTLGFNLSAYQYMDQLPNLDFNPQKIDNEVVNYKITNKIPGNLVLKTAKNELSIAVPYEYLMYNSDINLKVNTIPNDYFKVDDNHDSITYDLELTGLNFNIPELDPTSEGFKPNLKLKTSIYVGKNLFDVKVHQLINREDVILDSTKYDEKSGFVTFETDNISKVCVEVARKQYFTPTSNDSVENAKDLINTINNADDNSVIHLNYNNVGYKFDETSELNLIDKNIKLVSINKDSGLVIPFEINKPIKTSGKSNLTLKNVIMSSDKPVLLAEDNSTINLDDVNITSLAKNSTLVKSVATTNGIPTINVYGGYFKDSTQEVINNTNPLFLNTKTNDCAKNGNIFIYDGNFENINPADYYYTANDEIIYKSYLAEGTFCFKNKDGLYDVNTMPKGAYIANDCFNELFDVVNEPYSYAKKHILKNDVWFSPYLYVPSSDTSLGSDIEVSSVFNNTEYLGTNTLNIDFGMYSFNYSMNDYMLDYNQGHNYIYTYFDNLFNREVAHYNFTGYLDLNESVHKPFMNLSIKNPNYKIPYEDPDFDESKAYIFKGYGVNDYTEDCDINVESGYIDSSRFFYDSGLTVPTKSYIFNFNCVSFEDEHDPYVLFGPEIKDAFFLPEEDEYKWLSFNGTSYYYPYLKDIGGTEGPGGGDFPGGGPGGGDFPGGGPGGGDFPGGGPGGGDFPGGGPGDLPGGGPGGLGPGGF